MDISVIIPCFNREASIRGAVLSVLNQVGDHRIELIVVDDGSTDCSMSSIKDLNVKILHTNGRTGACNARNLGILAASHNWVAFNDSDDFWRIDKLNHIEEAIGFHDSDYIFHPFVRLVGLKSIIGGVYQNNSVQTNNDFLGKILVSNMISTQCLVAKKETLIKVGCFDVNLRRFQDWEIAVRIASEYKGRYVSEVLSFCIESSDSISKGFQKGIVSREYIYNKHYHLYIKKKYSMLRFLISLQLRKVVGILKRD